MGLGVPTVVTGGWSYVRFHEGTRRGPGYAREKLRRWAGRLEEIDRRAETTYAFFNNDPTGAAVRDARTAVGESGDLDHPAAAEEHGRSVAQSLVEVYAARLAQRRERRLRPLFVRQLVGLALLAPLGRPHLDARSPLLGQEYGERRRVAGVPRDDDLRRHAGCGAVLLQAERLEHGRGVLSADVLEVEGVAVDHLPVAQGEDLHHRAIAVGRQPRPASWPSTRDTCVCCSRSSDTRT